MNSPEQPYCPDDGDLIWINFDPQAGREQAGRRPALVLSPLAYNRKAGLCILCPVTSRSKAYPFEVEIPPGLAVSGVVLSDQVKSLSWERRSTAFAGRATERLRDDVRAKLKALLRF